MIRYSAGEILDMAVRIEQNGAAFYRRAAELQADDAKTDFLLKLADMEDQHEQMFLAMRGDLSAREKTQTAMDPYEQASLYLIALADTHGGEGSPSVAEKLTGQESMMEILTTARDLEKESILFYVGMLDLVPEELGKQRIQRIIDEEKSHVVTLTQELGRLK
jgi:rubrerythrin